MDVNIGHEIYGFTKAYIAFVSQNSFMGSGKVTMPMSSAGLIGFSADVKLGGQEIDPKALIISVAAIVVIVHAANLLI